MSEIDDPYKYIDMKFVEVSNRMIYFTQKLAKFEEVIQTAISKIQHIESRIEQIEKVQNEIGELSISKLQHLESRIQQIEKLGLGWK